MDVQTTVVTVHIHTVLGSITHDTDFIVGNQSPIVGVIGGILIIIEFHTISGRTAVHIDPIANNLLEVTVIVGIHPIVATAAGAAGDAVVVQAADRGIVIDIHAIVVGFGQHIAVNVHGGHRHVGRSASHVINVHVVIAAHNIVGRQMDIDRVLGASTGIGIAESLISVGRGRVAGVDVALADGNMATTAFHLHTDKSVFGVAEGNSESHFIEMPVSGTIKLENVNTITNSVGRVVVLSRTGKIGVIDKGGKELFSTALPYASMLLVNDGDKVEKGQKVAEWDPYSNTIIAEKDGIVSYNDLIENVSYQEEIDAVTGITSRKVINWKTNTKKALSPSIRLVDEKGNVISLGGKKIAEYLLPTYSTLNVPNGEKIHAGDILARIPVQTKKTGDITGGLPRVEELLEIRRPANPALLAEIDGTVELEDAKSKIIIRIEPTDGIAPVEYAVPKGTNLLVRSGDTVRKADKLVDGDPVPPDILRILGQKALAQFMVEQVQQVYRLQGVSINDKHIEILIREMTRRVEVSNPGDTSFISGSVVDRVEALTNFMPPGAAKPRRTTEVLCQIAGGMSKQN